MTGPDHPPPGTETRGEASTAKVFIGVPLYNNARTLRRTLDGILGQTEQRFEVLLSDDGSTDDTIAIAREYAQRDPRLSVHVQPVNLNYGNFRFLVQQATAPYFVFIAGDDWWEPRFLEECIEALEADLSCSGVTSRVRFEAPDGRFHVTGSTRRIDGHVVDRLVQYLQDPSDNSRMYGVFRTSAAIRAFPERDYHAFDWCFSAATLLEGAHGEIPRPLLNRDETPSSAYVRYVPRDNTTRMTRLFPLWPMTQDLRRRPGFPNSVRVVRALFRLNLRFHLEYTRHYLPAYAGIVEPVLRRVIARLAE